jgi:hypothetical protein
MNERSYDVEVRVDRVKEMAAVIVNMANDMPVREVMHATALATVALVRSYYDPPARPVVIETQIRLLRHSAASK